MGRHKGERQGGVLRTSRSDGSLLEFLTASAALFALYAALLWQWLCSFVQREAPAATDDDDDEPASEDTQSLSPSPPAAEAIEAAGKVRFRRNKKRKCCEVSLVRHGEREDHTNKGWKAAARSGHTRQTADDPPLSQVGSLQARETAVRFRADPPDFVVTSPFLRTIQTAREVAEKLGLPLVVEPGVAEFVCKRSFKEPPRLAYFMRQKLEDRRALCGPQWDPSYVPIEGELPQHPEREPAADARFSRVLLALVEANPKASVVVVTHRYGVQTLIDLLLSRKNIQQKPVGYCSVTTLQRRQGHWSHRAVADASHLSQTRGLFFTH